MVCVQYITRCINGVLGREITKYTTVYVCMITVVANLGVASLEPQGCRSGIACTLGFVHFIDTVNLALKRVG